MPDQPAGIELKLENGNVIKADNAEEALKMAAKMIEDNSKAYRETKASLDTVQGEMGTLRQQLEALKPKPEPTSGFNKDTYYQLLHDDPLKAQNYVDAARFGIENPDEVPSYINNMYEKVSKLDGNTLAAQFVNAHQDFPQDETTAQMMKNRVVELRAAGHPVDQYTMDMAYSQLIKEGKIKPMEEKEEEDYVPPSPTGAGSAISQAEMQKAENMSDQELQAYLKSKGML